MNKFAFYFVKLPQSYLLAKIRAKAAAINKPLTRAH